MPAYPFIENISPAQFNEKALELFQLQYRDNKVFHDWCRQLGIEAVAITHFTQIPFLPISLFKTHTVQTGDFIPEAVFKSSGTTASIPSRHLIKDLGLYKESFLTGFQQIYGQVRDFCVLALLPSYQPGSSLVMMATEWIHLSTDKRSGFYAGREDLLYSLLQELEKEGRPSILLGVSFALLDFAEKFSLPLSQTIVMETGGMKGRKKEITRKELHTTLKEQFSLEQVHAEYGMTELLSQAYAQSDGLFTCPPWMKVMVRSEYDPFQVLVEGRGILNIIDLANQYSCAFIATDDVGVVHTDGSFEVSGRLDDSDLRGCSLMLLNS